MAALSFPILLGVAGLSLDAAHFYIAKVVGQRIADQSALAAALAYGQTSQSDTAQAAAVSIGQVNGACGSCITTEIGSSPSGDGNTAAQATVVMDVALSPFGRMLLDAAAVTLNDGSLSVPATAYAELSNAGTSTGGASSAPTIVLIQ